MRFGELLCGAGLAALAGCTVSFTTGGDGGSEPVVLLEDGMTVASFELEAPVASAFVVRGTLPVPKGTWLGAPGADVPLAFRDHDGTLVASQVETVSRYANPADGADVVEVLAKVHRDPAVSPGTRVTYDVVYSPHAGTADPGTAGIEDLRSGPTPVPGSIAGLLGSATNLEVVSRDVFGHEYVARPLASTDLRIERSGRAASQLRSHAVMLPTSPVAGGGGTLPHLFGVHAYATVLADTPVLLLDLRVHNGLDGADDGSDVDDALGDVYFDALELRVPSGWVVLQDGVDPYFGTSYASGSKSVQQLVRPIGDGTLHLMPGRGQLHRRLAIAPASDATRAQALLDLEGLAFPRPGTDELTGQALLSWSNPSVPNYFPQSHQLPDLAPLGLDGVRAELTGDFQQLRGLLESGGNVGDYPVASDNLGWAHPYGVAYGGMTGGSEIHLYEGVAAASAASVDGYRHLQDQHRMQNDRMPVALVDRHGVPSRLETWLQEAPAGFTYVDFYFFNGKINSGTDVFGYQGAPNFQTDYVLANGLEPAYQGALKGFQPIDTQHLVRYTRSPKALAWLGNDALSKDDLRQQAELFKMAYHQHYNSLYQHVQGTGMRGNMEEIASNPGRGFAIGRGQGWGLDCAAAAYAVERDDAWRDSMFEWFQLAAETVADGQADCSGIIQAQVISHLFNSQYKARQSIEAAILENAYRGIRERVFDGADSTHRSMLDDVLHDSYYGMISSMSWEPGSGGPWSHLAVSPLGNVVPFCNAGQLPPDGHDQYKDTFQVWSSLAYAYEQTKNPLFLTMAGLMFDGAPLYDALVSDGLHNIENRAAMFALAQKLAQ